MTNADDTREKPARKKRSTVDHAAHDAVHHGVRAQGVRTRDAIIDVARIVLLEGGALEFSLREVAARVGISVSNLQYYFPTRIAVLRAVVGPVIDTCLGEIHDAVRSDLPPVELIAALARQSLRDIRNAEASALWWHFVSFALIDPECSRLLDDWYETLTREVAQLIRSAYPGYSPASCVHRATLLIAMIEGFNYQLGPGRRKRSYTRHFDAKFLAAVDSLLNAPLTATP